MHPYLLCLRFVSKQKFLDIYIDENLTWSSHIDYVCLYIFTKISLLCQLSNYVPVKVLKMFYQSSISPCIDYGSVTWGSASSSQIQRLNKLQNRAAQILLRTNFNTPSQQMFQELGWPLVPKIINYDKTVLTLRALKYLTPDYITDLLKPMSQVHSLNIRSSENGSLYVLKSRTSLYSGFTSIQRNTYMSFICMHN